MGTLLLVENPQPRFRLLGWGLRELGETTVSVPGNDAPDDLTKLAPPAIIINTEAEFAPRRVMADAMRVLSPESFIVELVPEVEEFEATEADYYLFEPYDVGVLRDWTSRVASPWSSPEARAELRQRAARAREASQRLRAQSIATRQRSTELHEAMAIWDLMRSGKDVV
jgi:hypothetical protein